MDNPVLQNSDVTVTFPPEYVLDSNIVINARIDAGATTVPTFTIAGSVITVYGLFAAGDVPMENLTLTVQNVQNPSPAQTTQAFTGTVGIDIAEAINI